jgi:VWFA-related protein
VAVQNHFIGLLVAGCICSSLVNPQDRQRPVFSVDVDVVVQSFTVTDSKGNYITGLKPTDIQIREDGVLQNIVAFAEGVKPPLEIGKFTPGALAGTKIFILFDTSNCMYARFAYASDAIAEFVRHLDSSDPVAVYTFSRNLFRAAPLTFDHQLAISRLRNAVAGDDTALYNTLLLTIRDAARSIGRKAVVVFSNGPDKASIVSPDDVAAVAQDEGIPLYVISTREAETDPISSNVFRRMTAQTGGEVLWATDWKKQGQAFWQVREELRNAYTVAYYPSENPNRGFRKIDITILSPAGKKCSVRTRPGYRAPTPANEQLKPQIPRTVEVISDGQAR